MSGEARGATLAGRTVLVTGGLGRLGPAIAEAVEARGGAALLTTRSAGKAERFNATAADTGRASRAHAVDLALEGECRRFVERVLDGHRAVHGLVNNAYAAIPYRPPEEAAGEEWLEAVRVGLVCAHELSAALFRQRERSALSSIVNVASIYGVTAPTFTLYPEGAEPPPIHYAAVKGALIQMTRYLAAAWAPAGVRVNAVSPGGIRHEQAPEFLARYEATVPMGRMVTKREVADTICFLLCDESSAITGENVLVDGGRSAW